MMSTRKEYILQDNNHFHAQIEVTRCGTIAIDIPETDEHFVTELDCVEVQLSDGRPCLVCMIEETVSDCEGDNCTRLELHKRDATDLNMLLVEASEEYEALMNDLL
ncbi:hypothetical protein [Vibrio tritonius]|uniref:hypothetical protein n=1 Tax=Vibrio tritonius TaxID=1435069 RepID=UPI00315DA8D9